MEEVINFFDLEIPKKEWDKWLNALERGEYPQASHQLQSKEGFCCLGVACKVTIPENSLDMDDSGFMDGEMPMMQSEAPDWITDINNIMSDRTSARLTHLNDVAGFNFKEIAKFLRFSKNNPNKTVQEFQEILYKYKEKRQDLNEEEISKLEFEDFDV